MNPLRLRILCRDEEELQRVKKAAEKLKPNGSRVLRDQLYPVKMDNVVVRAILTPDGALREDAIPTLEAENDVEIAKSTWLSDRDTVKEYGSMAVYFSKGEQAAEALRSGFFSVAGESAYTRNFLPKKGPARCYNCQQLGYKAYRIHETEHGSDHRAIDSLFDVATPEREQQTRPLFKNAPWERINTRVADALRRIPRPQGTQEQADRLLNAVRDAVRPSHPWQSPLRTLNAGGRRI
jgi:hypothetical protein